MNNFKKIGLSALAGSLVAVSAHAAEFSVSGSASITMDRPVLDKGAATGMISLWVIALISTQAVRQTWSWCCCFLWNW